MNGRPSVAGTGSKLKIGMALAVIWGRLRVVKPLNNRLWLVCVLAGSLELGAAQLALADTGSNPYQGIVERNPFGLKPPPPPQEAPPAAPAVPPGKVILTGITTMFGPPRALLEITEQDGKTAVTRRPILHEGDRDGGVELISIDVEKSTVKIRNAGTETNLVFEVPKLAGAGAPGGVPAPPGAGASAAAPQAGGAPLVFSPASAAANPGRNAGVTLFGNSGSSSPSASPSSALPASRTGVPATSYGGYGAAGASMAALPSFGTPGLATSVAATPGGTSLGLGSIPPRPLRTDTPNPAPANNVDPAQVYLIWAAQHEAHTAAGRPFPPPPPLPPEP